jgi:hypothetical protein
MTCSDTAFLKRVFQCSDEAHARYSHFNSSAALTASTMLGLDEKWDFEAVGKPTLQWTV